MSIASQIGKSGHTVSVSVLTSSTGVKQVYGSGTTFSAFIQPLDSGTAQIEGLNYGRAYQAFVVPACTAKEGDKVVDQDGHEYRVKGVKIFNFSANPYHILLLNKDANK